MVADLPELRQELHNMVYITEAETIMETFGQILEQSVAEGIEQGIEQGRREVLLEYVQQMWGAEDAQRFGEILDGASPNQIPTLTSLMEDWQARRPPSLRDTSFYGPGQEN